MATMFSTTIISAQDFEVDGIYYNITSQENKTVAVTYKKTSKQEPSVYYEGDITIPEQVTYNEEVYTVTEIGEEAFMSCNKLMSVSLPESIEKIGDTAFAWCSILSQIKIPQNVKTIESSAFYCCINLSTIQIPEGVKQLYSGTFNSCRSLKSISLPNSITNIENGVFTGCEILSTIDLPDSLTTIGAYTFYGCYLLDSITIPAKVNSISSDAFAYCRELKSLKVAEENAIYDSRNNCNAIIETASNALVIGCSKTQIPEEVTVIRTYAFYGIPITDIVFPEGLKTIEKMALRDCQSDKAVIIPESVERMDEYALSYSDIDSVIILAQINHIKENTFEGCINLTFIDLPNNIVSIENNAFKGCNGLSNIICRAETPPTCTEYTFYKANKHAIIEVPEESIPLYEKADVWKDFYRIKSLETENIIELPDSNRNIIKKGYGTYYATEDDKCTYLYSFDYNERENDPDSIHWGYWEGRGAIVIDADTIGANAFSNCTFNKGQIICFTENVKVILTDAFSYINILPRYLQYAVITDDITLVFESDTPPNIANNNIIDYAKVWPVNINFIVPNIETYVKSDIQWTYATIMTPEDVERGYIKRENQVHVSDTTGVDIQSDVENPDSDEEVTIYATVSPRKDIPVRIGDGENKDIYSRAPAWMRYTIEIMLTDCQGDTLFTQKRQCKGYEQCNFEIKLSKYPEEGIIYIHSRSIDQYGKTSEWTMEKVYLKEHEYEGDYVTDANVNLNKTADTEELTATIGTDSIRITGYFLSNCGGGLYCVANVKGNSIELLFHDGATANCVDHHYIDFTIPRMIEQIDRIYVINEYDQNVRLEVKKTNSSVTNITTPEANTPYYDLMGRKVTHPTRGIYIKNGCKVIVE